MWISFMKNSFLLLAFVCLMIHPSFAQDEARPTGLGLRANYANYLFPVNEEFNTEDFKFALEVEYIGHLGDAFNIAIPLKLGRAYFPTDEMGNFEDVGRISLDALLQLKLFREENFFYPYLFAGLGNVLENAKTLNLEAPMGLGLNLRLSKGLYLTTKAEYRVGFADLRNNAQLGAGLLLLVGKRGAAPPPGLASASDADGDGIVDVEDLCPQVAGTLALNGCPDRDADGVPDGSDSCPDLAGPANLGGCPDSDGDGTPDSADNCPQKAGPSSNNGCPMQDADGDGVLDSVDKCPNEAGPLSTGGCPVQGNIGSSGDRDSDGVPDERDACPDTPARGRADGCPDSDLDGVPDREDRCPQTVGPITNRGCPELTTEEREVLNFATQAVQFETGSAQLTPGSYTILNQIYEILLRYPDNSLKISGYSDSIGSSRTNQKLSERRAKTCYDYFVSQGISPQRITYIGYGEANPIADNRYKAGREKNRRVVFEIYLKD